MTRISITSSDDTWIVRADGAILAESRRALELRDGSSEPVVFIPREDVAMAFFEPSRTEAAPAGTVVHFAFVGPDRVVEDAAWAHEGAGGSIAALDGHLAFSPAKVTLQRT